MSYNIRIPLYSQQDIIETLQNYQDSEKAWEFASELTGLSVDKLNEKLQNLKEKERN